MSGHHQKFTIANALIAIGIIYGDIGTSPLYVMNAIIGGKVIDEMLIVGSLSCIIWTLTFQTTIKYILLTLQADNKGEGGIFSLYALVRRYGKKWVIYPAMVGASALIADGLITPPISVMSAIEGLRQLPILHDISTQTIIVIVVAVLSFIFALQRSGTASIGKLFGPIMVLWFAMLGILGGFHLFDNIAIFKSLNPYYAIHFLINYPHGFFVLGAVFLCVTGAEALYSDLGHCGKENIRMSWIYVKSCLILNYLGQGAWLLQNYTGSTFDTSEKNPFYSIMPEWFVFTGVIVATFATIIASQALISGSFTLVSEAIRLNLGPRIRIFYPTEERGQLYIPAVNSFLYFGCVCMVLFFQKSSHMEAAYGLAITLCMLSTSILFSIYLMRRRVPFYLVVLFLVVYLTIEISFFIANAPKFAEGGYISLLIGFAVFALMLVWVSARNITKRYIEYVPLKNYVSILKDISEDASIPKHSTHLVYMTNSENIHEIEHKITYSIINERPKRADIYWFVHINTSDDPYTCEYAVQNLSPHLIRIDFRLGFRIENRINYMFEKVIDDLAEKKEIDIRSNYASLHRHNIKGDFEFIVIEKYLSFNNELRFWERFYLHAYFFMKKLNISESKNFGLDPSCVLVEKYPIVIYPMKDIAIERVDF